MRKVNKNCDENNFTEFLKATFANKSTVEYISKKDQDSYAFKVGFD